MKKTANTSVKHIPLPKGWEEFEMTVDSHPGEGWLTSRQFRDMMEKAGKKISESGALRRLRASDMEKTFGRLNGRVVPFYRPKKAAKKGK